MEEPQAPLGLEGKEENRPRSLVAEREGTSWWLISSVEWKVVVSASRRGNSSEFLAEGPWVGAGHLLWSPGRTWQG